MHAWITAPLDLVTGQTYIVGAGDSLVREPLGDVLARVRPEWSELASHLAPTASLFSSDRARADTGWRARRSWRTEFAADASATTLSASR